MSRAFGEGFDAGFGLGGFGQLAIMVGDHPTYEDGDVLVAKNRRAIRCVHAEHICWPRINGKKVGGRLGNTQPLLETLLSQTHQYRWDRVSATEVKRTNLWTGTEIVYGSTPVEDPDRPGRMIHCNVEGWIARRVKAGKAPLFGEAGSEYWFIGDGRKDFGHTKLDTVWQEIEARTGNREKDHLHFPFSPLELTRFLAVTVDDFDDSTAGDLTAALVDDSDPENPVTLKKRKNKVNWRALRDVVPADVLDFGRQVDIRGIRKHVRASIVEAKQ